MELDANHVEPSRRSALVPAGYSAWWHMGRTLILASAIGAFALWLARDAQPVDWLLLPAFFLVANAIEWLFHKGPMHRPMEPRIFYKNHALLHHKSFHHDSMPVDDVSQLYLVMMPWFTMLLLFVLASPIALLAAWWRGPGAAGIFFLTASLYFLTYETLHALYHVHPDRLRRVGLGGPLLRRLAAHHTHHHRLDRMAHVNFNVTFPLMDWICGTKETEAQAPVVARRRHQAAGQ